MEQNEPSTNDSELRESQESHVNSMESKEQKDDDGKWISPSISFFPHFHHFRH